MKAAKIIFALAAIYAFATACTTVGAVVGTWEPDGSPGWMRADIAHIWLTGMAGVTLGYFICWLFNEPNRSAKNPESNLDNSRR